MHQNFALDRDVDAYKSNEQVIKVEFHTCEEGLQDVSHMDDESLYYHLWPNKNN